MAHASVKQANEKMDKTVVAFQNEMGNIRTARATAGMLDVVDVDVYGSRMKINQLGTVTSLDAQTLQIDLWDKSQIGVVEKAIQSSPLGVTPANDGKSIRVPFPPLTEDRRRELVKVAAKHMEEAKVSLRSVRRHAVDELKKLQKDGELPEDEAHRHQDEVQKLTDNHSHKIDELFKAKEADIMEV